MSIKKKTVGLLILLLLVLAGYFYWQANQNCDGCGGCDYEPFTDTVTVDTIAWHNDSIAEVTLQSTLDPKRQYRLSAYELQALNVSGLGRKTGTDKSIVYRISGERITRGSCVPYVIQKMELVVKPTVTDVPYKLGKRLYERNCTGCHDDKMMAVKTAPPLGGITQRRDKKWLYRFTRNSVKLFDEGDTLAIRLREENDGLLMTSFPHLDDAKLDALYYYIEKEYEKNKTP